jgi:hypothetical protein
MDTYEFLTTEKPILDLKEAQKYNGRINIIQPPNQTSMSFSEKIYVDNKSTDYRGALSGELENNILSSLFFSKENIQLIQNAIRVGVYEKSDGKYILPNQNENNLKNIIREIYIDHAKYDPNNITEQISSLNKMVIDHCLPIVYNESVAYEKYCFDQSTMVRPLELPKHHDRNFKQLEFNTWF